MISKQSVKRKWFLPSVPLTNIAPTGSDQGCPLHRQEGVTRFVISLPMCTFVCMLMGVFAWSRCLALDVLRCVFHGPFIWHRWLQETADTPEVARRDPNGGAIDCKEVWDDNSSYIGVS